MLITLLSALLVLLPKENIGTIVLQIENIASKEGAIQIALYQGESNFLKEGKELFPKMIKPITDSTATLEIPDVPFGTYAIAIYHDENGNGELDKNLVGIPKEAYSFSNNPKIKWRAPNYAETKFEFSSDKKVLDLRLRKWSNQ